jgi:hypothetical protein
MILCLPLQEKTRIPQGTRIRLRCQLDWALVHATAQQFAIGRSIDDKVWVIGDSSDTVVTIDHCIDTQNMVLATILLKYSRNIHYT